MATTTTAAATAAATTTKTLYRTLLRELPPISQKRTQLHARLRASISEVGKKGKEGEDKHSLGQLATYLRAQRTYATLLERYNPSLGPQEGDRIRMSARMVGLDMPE